MVNNTLVHVNSVRCSSLPRTLSPSLPPPFPPCFYLPSYLLPSKSDHPSLPASSASTRLFLFICLSSSGSQILPRCAFLSFPLLTLCCNFPPPSFLLLHSNTSTGIIYFSQQLHLPDGLPAFSALHPPPLCC